MRPRDSRLHTWFVLALLLVPTLLAADTVRLKNGGVLHGTVVEEDSADAPPGTILLRIGTKGTTRIAEADIEGWERDEKGKQDPPGAPPRAKESAAPATPAEPTLEEIVRAIAAEVVERHYAEGWQGASFALSPAEEEEVAEAASELTRQRASNRVRAENLLRDYGAAALPYLRPVASHPFALSRRAVQRLVRDAGAWEGGPIAIAGLDDPDEFVRGIAEEAVIGILGPEVDVEVAGISSEEAWRLWLGVEARRLAAILAETLEEFLSEEEEVAPESTASAGR